MQSPVDMEFESKQSGGNAPQMMSSVTATKIQKLNGENFLPWKRQVTIVLKLRGIYDAIVKERVDERTDMEAVLILLESMDDAHKIQVQAEETAKAIMISLERQYANSSANNLHRLLTTYINFKKSATDTIAQHLGKLKELRARLSNLGETQTENMFQVNLINSLSNEYPDLASVWNATPPNVKSTEFLLSILQEREEQAKQVRPEDHALLMRRTPKRMSLREIEEKKKVTRCGNCNELGHWWKECEHPRKDKKELRKDGPNFVANIGNLGPELKDKWLADTGASSHMCNNLEWFDELKVFSALEEVTVGDGYAVKVHGKGSVRVKTFIDNSEGDGLFKDVLYVPSLAANLISIGTCAENGIETTFSKDRCMLKRQGIVLMTGRNINGRLYQLNIKAVTKGRSTAMLLKDTRSAMEWHKVLGHPGNERMMTLLKDEQLGIKIKEDTHTDEGCEQCPLGSGKRVSHPSVDRPTETPGTVHVDLSGKINQPSLEGYYYYLVCKDEATEFSHVYFLKDKSESTRALASLINEYEVDAGFNIRYVCSDNGSEFVNDKNKLLFLKEHIMHLTSAPRTPQQNGRIEREIGTITNIARTLLVAAQLPEFLWSEAIGTACYLKNRLPTRKSSLSPFERFYGRKPFLKHLAVFGAEVQVLMNWTYRHKFEPKTSSGFLVGYTRRSNTYRVFVPSLNRVIETSDLYFQRHVNPVKTINTQIATNESDEVYTTIPMTQVIRDMNQQSHQSMPPSSPRKTNQEFGGRKRNSNLETISLEGCQAEKKRKSELLDNFFRKIRTEGVTNQGFSEELTEDDKSQLFDELSSQISLNVMSTVSAPSAQMEISERNSCYSPKHITTPMSPASVSTQIMTPIPEETFTNLSISNTKETPSLQQTPSDFSVPGPSPRDILSPCKTSSDVSSLHRTSSDVSSLQQAPNERSTAQRILRAAELLRKPSRFLGLTVTKDENPKQLNGTDMASDIPIDYTEAISGPESSHWRKAIQEELDAHQTNRTWSVVSKPKEGCTLTAKWIFTKKRNLHGDVNRFKARLVARGYKQREGIDYSETFAPVARIESIRVLLAICANKNLCLRQFDVSSAFLYGEVEEDIYLESPDGINVPETDCLKLNKSLYGLKQAPRCWHSKFNNVVVSMGFRATLIDPCVYVSNDKQTYLSVYVDDGLVLGRNESRCEEILKTLNESFKTKNMTGGAFLGMEIMRIGSSIHLTQTRYTLDIVKRYQMETSNVTNTPLVDTNQLYQDDSPQVAGNYREVIGSLLYCATHTRPDILYATTVLARFCEDPRQVHVNSLKRVLKYLNTNPTRGLVFEERHDDQLSIDVYSDSDWAGDNSDMKSTSGVILLLSGSPVIFLSKKQTITALSSAEAEYIAACEAAKVIEWLTSFLEELGINFHKPRLFVDNQSTIRQIKNNQISTKSKHVRLRFHFIRDLYSSNTFELLPVETNNQKADFLTKALAGPRLNDLLTVCNIKSKESLGDMMSRSEDKKTNSSSGRTQHLLLAMLVVYACGGCEGARKLTKAPNLIWLPTQHQVETGAVEIEVDLTYVSICHSIASHNATTTNKNITGRSYSGLREECFRVQETRIDPLLKELEYCRPYVHEESRFKRVVWWIPVILTLVVVSVVAAFTITSVFIAQHEQSIQILDNRTTQLEQNLQAIKDINEGVNNKSASALESLAAKSEQNRQMIEELVQITPELAWNTAKLYQKQVEHEKMLKDIVKSCQNGHIPPRTLGELINQPILREYDEPDTILTSVGQKKVKGERVHQITFLTTKRAVDSRIFEVKTFKIYKDLKNDPYLALYKGPKFALHNSTSNCTVGVEDSEFENHGVLKTCLHQNYRDPRFDHWVRLDNTPESPIDPQIMNLGIHKVIYCAYHNIKFDDETAPCPPYPIRLSRTESFTVGNYSHKAERLHLKGSVAADRIQSNAFKQIDVDQEYLDQMSLIKEVRKKNAELRSLNQNTMAEKVKWFYSGLSELPWYYIFSIFSVCLTIGSCCYRATSRNDGEHITVIQPSQPAVAPTVPSQSIPMNYYPVIHEESSPCCSHHPHPEHQQCARNSD